MFYGPFIQMKLITIAQRFRPTLDMVEGCHGHDRMVVRFITTYSVAMFEPRSGEVYSIQHYVIKFVLKDKFFSYIMARTIYIRWDDVTVST
jgi:hypothetical protein